MAPHYKRIVFFFVFVSRSAGRECVNKDHHTKLQSESVSVHVVATTVAVSALSTSHRAECGTISANPAGTPQRFDSRRRNRVTRFHATTATRFFVPFRCFLRSVWGQGDLGIVEGARDFSWGMYYSLGTRR